MNAPKYYTTKDGQRVIIPSRRERRAHWRATRKETRTNDKMLGLNHLQSTITWRASWQPLRGDL